MIESELSSHGASFRSQLMDASAYCAVLAPNLDSVCGALNSLGNEYGPDQLCVWHGRDFNYNRVSFADKLSVTDVAKADSMVVGIPYQLGCHQVTSSGGVEILIVERRGARYVARRRCAAKVDWTAEFVGKKETPRLRDDSRRVCLPKLNALEAEPIDAVYTWVDSTDPKWIGAMQEWAKREHVSLESSKNDERYLDRDELRYSLRSLWLFAPYVRNIFVVTAGHYPSWLNRSHDKIHVISHSAIFPNSEDLPTFNSHAIEACLHRISGLAENFIYFNDDVFLGRETSPNTFFTKAGLIKSRLSPVASVPVARPDSAATPTDWASYNAGAIIARDFGLRFDRKLKHVPMGMKRSLLDEIDVRYRDSIANTRRSRFRSPSDLAMPSMLAHFYGISIGKAVEWESAMGEYFYADTGRHDFASRLADIASGAATFICLNATRHNDLPLDTQALMLKQFLEEAYPLPSPFEIEEVR